MKYLMVFITIMYNYYGMTQENSLLIKGGTTIIAIITEDSIYVAADSKHVTKFSETKEIKENTTVCKLNITNNVCYAFAGSVDIYQNGHEIFNCKKIMEKVILNNIPFDSILPAFTYRLASELKSIFQSDNIPINPSNNSPFISVIITSFVNNQPSFYCVNYYLLLDHHDRISLEIKDVSSKTVPTIHHIGWSLDFENYLLQNPSFFDELGNLHEKLHFLINLQAKARPSDVGLPINMIKMTKDGWSWVIKNEVCQQ